MPMAVKHTSDMYKDHRGRMRERFKKNGAESFEDAKLLEFILYDLLPRVDTYPVAHNLLLKFKTLDGVFSASAEELEKVEGVGKKTALHISAVGKMFERIAESAFSSHPLNSYEAVHSYLIWIFRHSEIDSVAVLYLDNKGNLIECVKYPKSSRNNEKLTFDIKKTVAENGASRVVLAHKHPDGCLEASSEDLESTQVFFELCRDIGVRAEEHFIVSGNSLLPIICRVTGQKTELFEKTE